MTTRMLLCYAIAPNLWCEPRPCFEAAAQSEALAGCWCVQVWPLAIPNPLSGKALEPLARELRTIGRLVDKAFNLMQAPLGGDR
eukprot:SM000083S22744  [mRNA]  locus=s83:223751:224111:- [translate_table: standard]